MSYEGDWVQNLRHGKGNLTFENGDEYEGEWKNNLRHGYGVYNWNENQKIYKGMNKKGKLHGHGLLSSTIVGS